MLRTYGEVLRRPGALAFTLAGIVARLPVAMMGLGIVLAASAATGSYALAGLLAACLTIGFAIGSPLWSRVADRRGQRIVIPPAQAVRTIALIAFAIGIVSSWPSALLGALCIVAGLCQVSAGSLVRARWVSLLDGTASLRTAFALEGVLDELVFIVGPPLVTFLSLGSYPSLGIVVAVIVECIGMALLWMQRRTVPAPHPATSREHRGRLWTPASTAVIVAAVFVGGVFGSVDLGIVAFSRDQGQPTAAGVLLAVYAGGSLVGGLVIGALRTRFTLTRQYVVASLILTISLLPLPFVGSVPVMLAIITLAGLSVAPVLISGASLIERLVDEGRLTEGLTWLLSALLVGVAATGTATGIVVDRFGPSGGFVVAAACGVTTTLVALACRRVIRRGEAAGGD